MHRTIPHGFVASMNSTADRADVVAFVADAYLRTYGTAPPEAAHYAIVRENGEIVACMGIDLPEDGVFLIERVHKLDRALFPMPFTHENGVAFVRLVSTRPHATRLAIYAAAAYVLSTLKRQYAIVEHDRRVHRALERLGIRFVEVPRGGLDDSFVAPENRIFYKQDTMRPYLVDCEQIVEALHVRSH